MANAPKYIEELVEAFTKFPGIGRKGAERIAYFIVNDENRNSEFLCIVENMEDAIKIENTNSFDGLYHVLGGSISPLDGIGPSDLSFDKLLERINPELKEIIIATNPSTSGNATALYLEKILKDKKLKISRLAVGLPVGSNLEYIDDKTISTAIAGRVKLN